MEVPQGLVFVGFAAVLAVYAVRRAPHHRRPTVSADSDPLKYRSEDWRLSWGAVLQVLVFAGLTYLVLVWVGIW